MAAVPAAPPATASVESLADWLELRALLADDSSSSLTDLLRAIRPTGTVEEVVEEQEDLLPVSLADQSDELAEAVAEGASSELDDRQSACGDAYPFVRGAQYVEAEPEAVSTVYVFLLLLSTEGVEAGPSGLKPTDLFEDIAAVAARSYFGGQEQGVEVYQFGFPRRRTVAGFRPAIRELCARLGEGGGPRDRPNSHKQKDSKLDLVVWRPFLDGRSGKLVAFGQCAAGRNWADKLSEMQPRAFTDAWLTEPLALEPIRLFFCPFRVERDEWPTTVLSSGVLFDRCRIALHCSQIDQELLEKCRRFSVHALERRANA